MNYKSLKADSLSVSERQSFLTTAVAPRPIAFASTVDAEGRVNLSPFSFFNVFSANPPIMVFSPSRRGRDGTTKHTYENVKQVPEVVINIVNYPMVEQMSLTSTEYDAGVNEFEKAGFTEIASTLIKPPRVAESPVAFECSVDQIIELGTEGGSGNLVIARVEMIHVNEDYLDESGKLDPSKMNLVARMGGNWYAHAAGDALFEVEKPLRNLGIGVDQLPSSIRTSPILTGNNLGRIANLEHLPNKEEIEHARALSEVQRFFKNFFGEELRTNLHQYAQEILEDGDTKLALAVLLTVERD